MLFLEAEEGVNIGVVDGTLESIEEYEEDAQVDGNLLIEIFDEGEE